MGGLINCPGPMSGRLEVWRQGHWGAVCDSGWNDEFYRGNWGLNNSRVVCRHIYGENAIPDGRGFLEYSSCGRDKFMPIWSFYYSSYSR